MRRLPLSATSAAVLTAALAVAASGCGLREGNRWAEAPQPAAGAAATTAATAAQAKIILFAPVALGPLATVHPEARILWANDLALRVDVLGGSGLDGRFNEYIPTSDDPAWGRQKVAGTRGAHQVVLTEILELGSKAVGPGTHVTAVVEMRAVSADGNVVFRKRGYGEAVDERSPKLLGPANDPRSKAAWDACSNAVGALLKHLEAEPDDARLVQAGLVAVSVRSDPAGAEIMVDGIYRGLTPAELRLPPRVVQIRLEKTGYLPWQRQVEPTADMRIEPGLVRADSQK
ncbi:MAG: hypothetical protein RLZZ127_207 [Planctomycetota bacterium]|jgi:hypothetical protein